MCRVPIDFLTYCFSPQHHKLYKQECISSIPLCFINTSPTNKKKIVFVCVIGMASTSLHLLVTLLMFSHLICLQAVPITRTKNLWHGSIQDHHHQVSESSHLVITEEVKEMKLINGRMDAELNDYPGSGANNRHTPKPQLGRGCIDC